MLKKHRFSLGFFWLIAIFVLPLPLIQTLATGLPSTMTSERPAILAGTIAYTWMLLAIYLSTRPKWLDRLVGLPTIYMVHGLLSIAAIDLAYLHKLGAPSSGWIKLTGDWAFYLFVGLMLYSLIFMAGWLTSHFKILATIKRVGERYFKHEISVWLHRLNLIATALVFIHVQLISYVTEIHPFMIWFDGLTLLVAISYAWSKLQRFHPELTGKVTSNHTLTNNVQELTVDLSKPLPNKLLAGDFVFLAFPEYATLREPHPFSIINNPTGQQLTFAIRGDGDFTKALNQVTVNSKVELSGGFGRYQAFLNEQPANAEIVIIAGGMGAVPLFSIVAANDQRNIKFFYSAHEQNALLHPDQLGTWQNKPNFQINWQVGRYADRTILNALPDNWQNETLFLIGGSTGMQQHWQHILRRHGAKPGQIYSEKFDW